MCVSQTLESDHTSIQGMRECLGFQTIAHILGQKFLGNIGSKVVEALHTLSDALRREGGTGGHDEKSPSSAEAAAAAAGGLEVTPEERAQYWRPSPLWLDVQMQLVWRFPLWVFTPAKTQLRLFGMLRQWIRADRAMFREIVGVQCALSRPAMSLRRSAKPPPGRRMHTHEHAGRSGRACERSFLSLFVCLSFR